VKKNELRVIEDRFTVEGESSRRLEGEGEELRSNAFQSGVLTHRNEVSLEEWREAGMTCNEVVVPCPHMVTKR
jgi:hypothetical protein